MASIYKLLNWANKQQNSKKAAVCDCFSNQRFKWATDPNTESENN